MFSAAEQQFVISTIVPTQSFIKLPYNVQCISLTQVATKHPKSYSVLRNCEYNSRGRNKNSQSCCSNMEKKTEGARAWRAGAAVLPKTELSNPKPLFLETTVVQLNTNHTRSQHHYTSAQKDRFCSGFLQTMLKTQAGNLKNTRQEAIHF